LKCAHDLDRFRRTAGFLLRVFDPRWLQFDQASPLAF
jgi:hypothetical protein